MNIDFRFSALLGTVYKKGNVLFTNDGNSVISSVGNKVSVFDLKNNTAKTLAIESDLNVRVIALHPAGAHLFVVNEGGEALYINARTEVVLYRHRFYRKVSDAKFSPNGKYIAVCRDGDVQVFLIAGFEAHQFNPFMLRDTYKMTASEVRSLNWSCDSRLLCAANEDKQVRIVAAGGHVQNFYMQTLAAHKGAVVGSYFFHESYDMVTVGQRGVANHWVCNLQEGDLVEGVYLKDAKDVKRMEYTKAKKQNLMEYLSDNTSMVNVTACAFHAATDLLIAAFSNGVLLLMEMPSFNLIHSIRVSELQINSLNVNMDGDWLAIGCGSGTEGQLIVWEWQSETYVMKQQSHSQNMTTISYSPDGSRIATGSEDGKVKVWSHRSSFCIVTFTEHTSGVTGVCWTPDGKAVLSASLDGVVRAHDLLRYRNFRTLVCPEQTQLNCLAVDSGGEIVMAASHEIANIFIWSLQNGQLLDVLAGHDGPIAGISVHGGSLVSASWDKTIRIWNVVEGSNAEPIQLTEEALDVSYSPSGAVIAVLCLDGLISLFETTNSAQLGEIDTMRDVDPARSGTEVITKKTSEKSKTFTSICFSADGLLLLAAGRSNYVCMYSVAERVIVRKFKLTMNRSLDGVQLDINRRNFSDFGNMSLIDASDSEDEGDGKKRIKLAGTKNNDLSERRYEPEMRVYRMNFSPTGRSFAVCSTEGISLFSLDHRMLFDPFELTMEVTPEKVRETLHNGEYSAALKMALQLNQTDVICDVFLRTPCSQLDVVARSLPSVYVTRLLSWMSEYNDVKLQQNFHFWSLWLKSLLVEHARTLKNNRQANLAALTGIQQQLVNQSSQISKLCDQNIYGLEYILAVRKLRNESVKSETAMES